jgi:hypothetical protein
MSVNRSFVFFGCVVYLILSANAFGQVGSNDGPVFDLFPSPAELQQAVDDFKRERKGEYELALHDFLLAVRINLEIDWPGSSSMHVIPKGRLHFPALRPSYEDRRVAAVKEGRTNETRMQFHERYGDEITVEFVPALRIAVLDVLLNGIQDWSGWDTDRLIDYRQRYPDIFRIMAVRVLSSYDHQVFTERLKNGDADPYKRDLDPTGLILRVMYGPKTSYDLRKEVASMIGYFTSHPREVLDYLVRRDLEIADPSARPAQSILTRLSDKLSLEERRAFWLPYLSHSDTQLRMAAVNQLGSTRTRPPKVAAEAHPDRELIERMRTISRNDPDAMVRFQATNALKRLVED